MKLIFITLFSTLLLSSTSALADRSNRSDRFEYDYDVFNSFQFGNHDKSHKWAKHSREHKHPVERSQMDWELILKFSNLSGLSISHVEIVFDQYRNRGLAVVAFKLGISRTTTGFNGLVGQPSYRSWNGQYAQFNNVRSMDRVTLDKFYRR